MKKLAIAPLALAFLVGCGQVPTQLSVAPMAVTSATTIVKDLGFKSNISASVHVVFPNKRSVQAITAGWTVSDIYQYDLVLNDITDPANAKALVCFSISCKNGNAEAMFTHLKPGSKYQVVVTAKGNRGGTAPDQVLNTQVPADGYFDLTKTPADAGAEELSTSITVQLDGAYDRSGSVSLVPLDGNTIDDGTGPAGQGTCTECAQHGLIAAGTTSYDSVFKDGTSGDPFDTKLQGRWTNSKTGNAWVQRDFGGWYKVRELDVRHAYSDLRFGPCTGVVLKLLTKGDKWVTVDDIANSNLDFYVKRLDKPVEAKAFRLEMASQNGWFTAQGLGVKGSKSEHGDDDKDDHKDDKEI